MEGGWGSFKNFKAFVYPLFLWGQFWGKYIRKPKPSDSGAIITKFLASGWFFFRTVKCLCEFCIQRECQKSIPLWQLVILILPEQYHWSGLDSSLVSKVRRLMILIWARLMWQKKYFRYLSSRHYSFSFSLPNPT